MNIFQMQIYTKYKNVYDEKHKEKQPINAKRF